MLDSIARIVKKDGKPTLAAGAERTLRYRKSGPSMPSALIGLLSEWFFREAEVRCGCEVGRARLANRAG